MSAYVDRCRAYAAAVVAGELVAGKWARLACQRHLDDLERSQADPSWPYVYSPDHAHDVCDFVEKLPHVEGSWSTEEITLEDPQVFILCVVFGWRRRDALHVRRFSKAYIEMARKGAKSTLSAAVSLYCLTCEGEVGPQIIVGATTGEQAKKVFEPAKRMVQRSPDLREWCGVEAWARSISMPDGGYMQPVNAKGKTQDGWNPHVGVLDEIHAHRDRGLFDVIDSAFGARSNPLMWMITTSGYSTVGVCYEQHAYTEKILEGVLDAPHYFGIIFAIDKDDDPYDPAVWPKANPLLGVTPTLDSMRRAAADAKASPSSEGEFLTKRCCVWRNATDAWLNSQQWKACGDASLSWDAFRGLDCYVGADLADKDDITAAVVVAMAPGDRLICKPVFWLPEAVIQDPVHAEGRGPAPYVTWAKQGHLRLTPGDWVDHNEVEAQIRDWLTEFAVRRVTFDQFAAAQAMASRLNEDHGAGAPLAGVLPKNARNITDAAKDLESRVKAGPARFCHDDNPILNWMASNVVASRRRDGTILPIKESPMSPMKIDGIDALLNGAHPLIGVVEHVPGNPYDAEGVVLLAV